jgi:hypothetical protein
MSKECTKHGGGNCFYNFFFLWQRTTWNANDNIRTTIVNLFPRDGVCFGGWGAKLVVTLRRYEAQRFFRTGS